jgi:hypothetical protein
MTLWETCRLYNGIVKKMLEAAKTGEWDQLISLDQQCHPYIEGLQAMSQQAFEAAADESVRLLIGEIVAYYADISALARDHRNEIKAALSVDSKANKLNRLYGF